MLPVSGVAGATRDASLDIERVVRVCAAGSRLLTPLTAALPPCAIGASGPPEGEAAGGLSAAGDAGCPGGLLAAGACGAPCAAGCPG